MTFNESLAATLAQVQEIHHRISSISGCLAQDDLSTVIAHLLRVNVELDLIQSGRNIKAVALLRSENGYLRESIVQQLTQRWHDSITINLHRISLSSDTQRELLQLPISRRSSLILRLLHSALYPGERFRSTRSSRTTYC